MSENTPPTPSTPQTQKPSNGFKTGLQIGLITFGLLMLLTLMFGAFKRYPRGNSANIYSVLMLAAWILPPLASMIKTAIQNLTDNRLWHIIGAGLVCYQFIMAFLYIGVRIRNLNNGFGGLRGDDIDSLLGLLWGNVAIVIVGVLLAYFTRPNSYNSRYGRP